MKEKIICPRCNGNGYIRVTLEAEKSVVQCKTCESQGEFDKDKFFSQSWKEAHGSTTFYNGPLLNPKDFKDWKIHYE